MAGKIGEIAKKHNLGFVYKTSFDKANRTSLKGKRGVGLENSLPVFDKIKKDFKEKEIVVLINKCDVSAKIFDDNLVSLSALQISAKIGLNIDKLI